MLLALSMSKWYALRGYSVFKNDERWYYDYLSLTDFVTYDSTMWDSAKEANLVTFISFLTASDAADLEESTFIEVLEVN